MKKEKIFDVIGTIGILLYLLSHWIEPSIVILFASCSMWLIQTIYNLTKWNRLSLFSKIINVIILILIANAIIFALINL